MEVDENLGTRTVHLVTEADVVVPEFPVRHRRKRTQVLGRHASYF